jgi:ketosteroid isomerase-like protein
MKRILIALSFILFAGQAICGDVRSELSMRNSEWTDAFNRGDIDSVVAIYADDFSVVPNGGDPISDRAQLKELMEGFAAVSSNLKFETVSVDEMGEFAYEFGRTSYELTDENGTVSPAGETYLVIWEKGEDGVWYYLVDAWWDGAGLDKN